MFPIFKKNLKDRKQTKFSPPFQHKQKGSLRNKVLLNLLKDFFLIRESPSGKRPFIFVVPACMQSCSLLGSEHTYFLKEIFGSGYWMEEQRITQNKTKIENKVQKVHIQCLKRSGKIENTSVEKEGGVRKNKVRDILKRRKKKV